MFDKESDLVDYSGFASGTLAAVVPSSGWGFGSRGFVDSLEDFVNIFQGMPLTEREAITAFMEEFDSGMAPAVAHAFTLTAAKAGSPQTSPVVRLLIPQADAGSIDLIGRGWCTVWGRRIPIGLLYDRDTGRFDTSFHDVQDVGYARIDAFVRSGHCTFTFLGVPRGSGYRLGVDRDMDALLDGDERRFGTSVDNPDSDGDGFPDGHELAHLANPLRAHSVPFDRRPPRIEDARVAWVNTQVAKVRWTTNEPATSVVRADRVAPAALASAATPPPAFDGQLKREHVLVVRGLEAGVRYRLRLTGRDAAGNVAAPAFLDVATQDHLFESVHAGRVTLATLSATVTSTQATTTPALTLTAEVLVVNERNLPEPGSRVSGRFVEWLPGAGQAPLVTPFGPSPVTGADGRTRATYTAQHARGSGAIVEVIVDAIEDDTRLHFHPLETSFFAREDL
jgi:hypothetical protein